MAKSGVAGYAKVVVRAWKDPTFKAQLLADANAALATMGIPVPPGKTVRVVEGTDEVSFFILALKPTAPELFDEVLAKAAAGLVCRHIVNTGPQPRA